MTLMFGIIPRHAQAISASPHPVEETQPDGTKIKLHIRGDEYFHWHEDMEGYSVGRSNVRYVYAQLNKQSRLTSTDREVGKVNPKAKGLARKNLPPAKVINSIRKQNLAAGIDEVNSSQPDQRRRFLPRAR
jgi:hypothetical protein